MLLVRSPSGMIGTRHFLLFSRQLWRGRSLLPCRGGREAGDGVVCLWVFFRLAVWHFFLVGAWAYGRSRGGRQVKLGLMCVFLRQIDREVLRIGKRFHDVFRFCRFSYGIQLFLGFC